MRALIAPIAAALMIAGCSPGPADRETLYQTSMITALMAGRGATISPHAAILAWERSTPSTARWSFSTGESIRSAWTAGSAAPVTWFERRSPS